MASRDGMRLGVVGVGKLGGAVAFALARETPFEDLVLVDAVEGLAWAQAEDIRHGLTGRAAGTVRAGTIEDLRGADVVVVTAGRGRRSGMTRLDLLHANAGLVSGLAKDVARVAPRAALVILTNPVDVMTTIAQEISGLPREQVVGSGALLDSFRLRALLAERLGARPSEIEAFVLGEHGDRAVPVFSRILVRGAPLTLSTEDRRGVTEDLRTLAARVIEVKQGTAFGPAGCTTALVQALAAHTPSVVPASVVLAGEYGLRDIAMGVPAVVGQGRVLRVEEWPLRSEEQAALQEAGHDLRRFVDDARVVLGFAVHHSDLPSFVAAGNR